MIESDQEIDGADSRHDRVVAHPLHQQFPRSGTLPVLVHRTQIDLEVITQIGRVAERKGFGELLDEEIEWVDDLQVGDQPDGDGQRSGGLGEDQAGHEVAEGILLPVDEVVGRFDIHRVGLDGSATVRRGAQPHYVWVNLHEPVEGVAGPMFQRHFNSHRCDPTTPRPAAQARRIVTTMKTIYRDC